MDHVHHVRCIGKRQGGIRGIRMRQVWVVRNPRRQIYEVPIGVVRMGGDELLGFLHLSW